MGEDVDGLAWSGAASSINAQPLLADGLPQKDTSSSAMAARFRRRAASRLCATGVARRSAHAIERPAQVGGGQARRQKNVVGVREFRVGRTFGSPQTRVRRRQSRRSARRARSCRRSRERRRRRMQRAGLETVRQQSLVDDVNARAVGIVKGAVPAVDAHRRIPGRRSCGSWPKGAESKRRGED